MPEPSSVRVRSRRVAALYDIHGNLPALEAVLEEVEREAPDLIVIGGDIAAGPMPAETVAIVRALGARAHVIRGNTDRELVECYDGSSTLPEEDAWVRALRWAAGKLARPQRDFLASLGETLAVDIEGLAPTLFCHGSPRSDEESISSLTPAQRLGEMLAGTGESAVVCGHTHAQFDRTHGSTRIVNAGSVGMPSEGRPGAYWSLIGPGIELRRTVYDIATAETRIRATGYPEADELLARLRGERPDVFRGLRREDFGLLASWLAEPLVARWWNHESTPEAVERDFGPSVDGRDATELFLALLADRPFGLIQRYPIAAYPEYVSELSRLCSVPPGALSIDYLIGEPDARGRGLGAAMVSAFVAAAWPSFPAADAIIVPIAAGNVASWRALERAGFARIAEGELEPDNPQEGRHHYVYAIRRP